VQPGDILVGKITPKGESPMTPEEKLLRAIFGEKASDVRDTSLRVPPGVQGTIVEVRVFNRHGVDKDERAHGDRARGNRASRQGPRRRARHPGPQRLQPSAETADRQEAAVAAPKGFKKGDDDHRRDARRISARSQWWQFARRGRQADGRDRGACGKQYDEPKKRSSSRFHDKVEKLQRGDELPPGVMKMVKVFVAVKRKLQPGDKMAGRHGNKGVVSRIVPVEDMPLPGRRHAGRHRAEPARRAVAHERRSDPRDPSGLGLRAASASRSAQTRRC
jgi:DNA-directed RNA polymerase subunit beta